MTSGNRAIQIALVFFLVAWLPAYATLGTAARWNVRTGGDDTNGGAFDATVGSPGTDFSQQDAAQVTYTDLIIGATTTQLTSVLNPFGATSPGNTINVTSGTGCTTGRYTVLSVSGVTATMDRSVGTAASTCAGKLGGGLLTLQAATDAAVSQNTICVESGTYTLTSTVTVQAGGIHQQWIGYQTTCGDRTGVQPLVTTATNSTALWTVASGQYQWANFKFTNTAGTKSSAFKATASYPAIQIADSILDGFTDGLDLDGTSGGQSLTVNLANVEITNCSNSAVRAAYTGVHCFACYIHDNTKDGIFVNLGNMGNSVVNSIFYKNGRYALYAAGSASWNVASSFFHTNGTTFAGNPFPNVAVSNGDRTAIVANSIFFGGGSGSGNHYLGATGCAGDCIADALGHNNAFDSVGMGGSVYYLSVGDISLSADPATNAAAGNFTLNSTAGGGLSLAAAGFPGTIIGTTGTPGSPDIGGFPRSSSSPTGGNGFACKIRN